MHQTAKALLFFLSVQTQIKLQGQVFMEQIVGHVGCIIF